MRSLIFILILLASFTANSKIKTPIPEEEIGPIKSLMHFFEQQMSKMKPYLGAEATFTSKEGKAQIKQSLELMNKKIQGQKIKTIEANPGFRVSYDLLAEHFEKANESFSSGDFETARIRINATTNLCATCHMQVPQKEGGSWGSIWGTSNDFKNVDFETAEYLFITRRFDLALVKFDELARQYPQSKLEAFKFKELYRRKLALFARIFRNPQMASENLNEDLKNKNLPADVRQNIMSWIDIFSKWSKEKTPLDSLSNEKLLSYISKNLPAPGSRYIAPADPDIVNYLRYSGELYDRLISGDTKEDTQEFLYLISMCEKHISPMYWYSLSDTYLKECIIKFPKKPYAKKCYDAYEASMIDKYTNRGGMPEGVKNNLARLKEML